MPRIKTSRELSQLVVIVAFAAGIAVLYFAKAVLVPVALAILFTFVLNPLVRGLEKIRMPRVAAVLLVVFIAVAALGSTGWVVASQLVNVTSQLPNYRTNIRNKIESFRNSRPDGLNKATEAVQVISTEIASQTANPPAGIPTTAAPPSKASSSRLRAAPAATPEKPVPVEVVPPPSNILESIEAYLGPLGTAGMVVVFTIFMLFQRDELRDRFIRLAATGRLSLMAKAMDEAGQRVSHYLLLQSLVNACYGLIAGAFLYAIGVPNALLWGVLAGLLRFLPYIGPPVGALAPVLFSLAVFDGWNHALMVLSFFVVIEIVVANFIEPMLYGARTGISSLAVLVAAVFWTFLWGPIGLVLSTPLTVCLVVLGRHVPNMQFLNVLFGDDPVLVPGARFYLRLIAADENEAHKILKPQLKGRTVEEFYDTVMIPALALAERDRYRDDLDGDSTKFIYKTVRDFVKILGDRKKMEALADRMEKQDHPHDATASPRMASRRPVNIVCVPAWRESDEIIALMLVQLLEQACYSAKCVALEPTENMIAQVQELKPDILCISALPPFSITHARRLYQELSPRFPHQNVVIGLWNFPGNVAKAASRIDPSQQIQAHTTLAEMIRQIGNLANLQSEQPEQPHDVRNGVAVK